MIVLHFVFPSILNSLGIIFTEDKNNNKKKKKKNIKITTTTTMN